MIFEPSRNAEPLRATVATIDGAELVISDAEAVVVLEGRGRTDYHSAREMLLERARAVGLEFTVEDEATIEPSCAVRLDHRAAPIHSGLASPR